MTLRFVGIDVGAAAVHCVVLDGSRRVLDGRALPSDASAELEALTRGATAIAIDAPSALSTGPHADDADAALAPKFRFARCCEIALGREHRLWVPWATPTAAAAATVPVPGWMQVGFRLYQDLAAAGHRPIEVFPYAGFRVLAGAGGRLPSKATIAGVGARVALLQREGVGAGADGMQLLLELWSNDALDAALAALLAVRAHEGTAIPVGCGHDHSAIWIPRGPS